MKRIIESLQTAFLATLLCGGFACTWFAVAAAIAGDWTSALWLLAAAVGNFLAFDLLFDFNPGGKDQ